MNHYSASTPEIKFKKSYNLPQSSTILRSSQKSLSGKVGLISPSLDQSKATGREESSVRLTRITSEPPFATSLNRHFLKQGTLLQRCSVSLAWRLEREMRRRLMLHETGFTR